MDNTSLAAPGALANRRTARKVKGTVSPRENF